MKFVFSANCLSLSVAWGSSVMLFNVKLSTELLQIKIYINKRIYLET